MGLPVVYYAPTPSRVTESLYSLPTDHEGGPRYIAVISSTFPAISSFIEALSCRDIRRSVSSSTFDSSSNHTVSLFSQTSPAITPRDCAQMCFMLVSCMIVVFCTDASRAADIRLSTRDQQPYIQLAFVLTSKALTVMPKNSKSSPLHENRSGR